MKFNKYGNKKMEIDGITFDSKKEALRYADLKLLQLARKVKMLTVQPSFVLQEGFKDKRGTYHKQIKYVADFQYYDIEKKQYVVEDVKGMKTDVYRLKKKLFLYKYPDTNFIEV